jgi:hypothetical protein
MVLRILLSRESIRNPTSNMFSSLDFTTSPDSNTMRVRSILPGGAESVGPSEGNRTTVEEKNQRDEDTMSRST